MNIDKRRNLISLGLVIGTLAGAAAAFFHAPTKGTDTKKMLARKANDVTQKSITKTQDILIDLEVALEGSLRSDNNDVTL